MKTRFRDLTDFFEQTERTQQWLADALDVDRSYISLLANGQRQPSLALAVKIADLTGVPIESLITESNGETA